MEKKGFARFVENTGYFSDFLNAKNENLAQKSDGQMGE